MMADHIEYLRHRHERTFSLLDRSAISSLTALSGRADRLREISGHADFSDNGRGMAYRARQLMAPLSREHGDRRIFAELELRLGGLTGRHIGLDVIGGNGATARSAAALLPLTKAPYIIAGDPSLDMVKDALSRNLPAVWQSAQETLFRDQCLDFVIGSRGFHHIPVPLRAPAVREAWRILMQRGVVMILDFEEGSPTARWYSEGLHTYTNTGHCFAHFRRHELMQLLADAGFKEVCTFQLYDPFRFWAATPQHAHRMLLEHVTAMFGMVRLQRSPDEPELDYWERVDRILAPWCTFTSEQTAFDPEAVTRLSLFQEPDGRWRAELPRVALCAAGIK